MRKILALLILLAIPAVAQFGGPMGGMRPGSMQGGGLLPGRGGDALWVAAGPTKPTLDLNFAQRKDLTDAVSSETSLVTFSRSAASSPGTYVGSDGLIHDAAVNELLYSEQLDNAWWKKTGTGGADVTVSANQTTSPDGKQTAEKIIPTATLGSHFLQSQDIAFASGVTYTFSVYAKKAEYAGASINIGASRAYATFNLNTNTVNFAGAALSDFVSVSGDIESVGDGWVRLQVTATSSINQTRYVRIAISNDENSTDSSGNSFSGDGVSGIFFWGAQLEETDAATMAPTAYIHTTSQALAAPRFDHDPVTGESLGLLVEEARTNLFLSSDTLATQTVTTTAAAHTLSFYGTGTVDLTGTYTATVVGAGAYPARTTLTFTPTAGSLTATVTGTVEFAQLEAGSFPTSYIPTSGTSLTRAADVAAVQDEDFSTTNLLSYSESFTSWGDTNISRDSTTETAPDGQATALQVSASSANGTVIYPSAMGTSAERVFSIYLRRVTGTGDVQYTLDNGSNWTTVAITSSWQRYIFPKSTAAQRPGIRIVTSGDAIEMWGASLTATEYPVDYTTTRNLLTDSQDFERSGWIKSGATVDDDVAQAPDGTLTADKIKEDLTSGGHRILQFPSPAGGTYTVSAYAKAAERTQVVLRSIYNASTNYSLFDLSAGSVTNIGVAPDSATITDAGDGWHRITRTDTTVSPSIAYFGLHNGTTDSYLGDGTSGILLWGAQLEPGTAPTDYVRTVDVVGKAYQWYEPTEGTVFVEAQNPASGTRGIVGIDDNTANERIEAQTDGTDPEWLVIDGGSGPTIDAGSVTAYTFFLLAGAYKHNDLAASVNGGAAVTDTVTIPSVNLMRIGALQASGTYLNGHIKRLTYWPVRQADSTLQVITQ